jgi:hypothetical protein
LVVREFTGHDCTYRVAAVVTLVDLARSIAKVPDERIDFAEIEF